MDWSRYLSYALMPLRAILSQRFYYDVLFKLKGVGLLYMLILCAVLALPGTYQVKQALNRLQDWELSTVVAKIPPSYISPQGTIAPDNPQDGTKPLIVRNSRGSAVLAYNLEGAPLRADQVLDPERPANANLGSELIEVPITFTAHDLLLNTVEGTIAIPWNAVYGDSGGSFAPLETAQVLDAAFHSSYFALWGMVMVWLLSILGLVVLVSACLLKPLSSLGFKLRISFATALRLSAFGSTLVALLLLLQFFYNYALSYTLVCLIPLIYGGGLLWQVRKHLKYALNHVEQALNVNHPMYPMFDLYSRVGPNHEVERGPEYSKLDEAGKERRRANLARNLAIVNIIFQDGYFDPQDLQDPMSDYQYYQNMGSGHAAHDAQNAEPERKAQNASQDAVPDAEQNAAAPDSAPSAAPPDGTQSTPHDAPSAAPQGDPWTQVEQETPKNKDQGSFIP